MGAVPILMYHKVAPRAAGTAVPAHYVAPARFRAHVRLLRALGYESVRLGDLFDAPLPRRPVGISFDDGYAHLETHAIPPLRAAGMVGTFFVVPGLLGGVNAWDEGAETLVDADGIRRWATAGMEIGSHTLTHADLPKTLAPDRERELCGSRDILAELLGEPPAAFCYPYGRYDDAVREAVAAAGYRTACTVRKGVNRPEDDRLTLRRVNVRSDTGVAVLIYKILRSYRHA